MLRPAIFLDRDGVINFNRSDHVKSWSEFEFLPGVLLALRRLSSLEWPVVVISNQAAIGRGLVSRETVEGIHHRMMQLVERAGGRIDAAFYCPHRPEDGCACRKPAPGMLLQAADALGLDLAKSYLVGDAVTDMQAARVAGCYSILVETGRGKDQLDLLRASDHQNVYVVADLSAATDWILERVARADEAIVPVPTLG
jgi:D-glycero-D-manno-heptose 1,7-bisphosphate phosphatase